LVVWLVDWLFGWLIGCLVGCLVVWLIGWLLVACLNGVTKHKRLHQGTKLRAKIPTWHLMNMRKESYFCNGEVWYWVLKIKQIIFAIPGANPGASTFEVLYSPQYTA